MSIDKIVAIGIRLFAITLFIEALDQAYLLFDVLQQGNLNGLDVSFIFITMTTTTPLILGLILWFFPLLLSKKIIKSEINTELSAMDVKSFLTAIIIGLGLFTLSYAIPDIILHSTRLHLEINNPNGLGTGTTETKSYLFVTLLEIAIGMLFILKAKTCAATLQKVSK
jgi:hypothetical protein